MGRIDKRTPEQRRTEAIYWNAQGDNYSKAGLMLRAITCYKRSRSISSAGDPLEDVEVDAWNLVTKLASAYQALGKTRSAISYFVEGLQLARAQADNERELETLTRLCKVYSIAGYIHHAAASNIQRTSLYRLQGDRASEASALEQLGRDYDTLGDIDEAIETCEQSLAIAREIRDRKIESIALVSLGRSYGHLGYASRFLDYSEQALHISRELKDRSAEEVALEGIGDSCTYLDELQRAEESYNEALSISRDLSNEYDRGRLLEKLGLVYLDGGETERAFGFFEQSFQVANEIGALYNKGRMLGHLGNIYAQLRQFTRAEEKLLVAEALINRLHLPRGYALLAYYKAKLFQQQNSFEESRDHYKRAITLFDDLQDRYCWARCTLDYAGLLREQGEEPEAIRVARSTLAIYRERGTEAQVMKVQAWIKEM